MKRSSPRKVLFDRMLKDRLQWHKRARVAYKDAGFNRGQLDEDALIILLIEVAEIIWRHDLETDDVASDIRDLVADIENQHPETVQ